jgi:hypothetical protein
MGMGRVGGILGVRREVNISKMKGTVAYPSFETNSSS